MLKLLIADDSALMRKYLGDIFRDEGDFDVCVARNGVEALALAHSFDPDVITLDVNMPEMDGITCLSEIMVDCPKPVVMVSSLTAAGAEVTFQALALGAVDFIEKPDGTVSLHIGRIRNALVSKVRNAAGARVRQSRGLLQRTQREGRSTNERRLSVERVAALPQVRPIRGIVLIGVSTGGPAAIEAIIPALSHNFAWPIVIAQHMPASFTSVFSDRINNMSSIDVVEVARPTALERGVCYVGRGDADVVIGIRAGKLAAIPIPSSLQHVWHPSVDRLVTSALKQISAPQLIGVLLTGMGDDGSSAMADLRARGGRTIAESEESAVVWGMPGELVRRGGASVILPLGKICDQLNEWAT